MKKKPTILTRGDDPNCVHHEYVIGYIGTCLICGQVRDYERCQDGGKDPFFVEKGKKGAKVCHAL